MILLKKVCDVVKCWFGCIWQLY